MVWLSAAACVLTVGGCAPGLKREPNEQLASSRTQGSRVPDASDTLRPNGLSELSVTSGVVQAAGTSGLALRSPTIRAIVPSAGGSVAEAAFVYLGPSRDRAPLASGEMRQQFGLKLRALDTCNVVYVMWHIAPTSGIHVSVKSNPGETEHSQCGDRGYLNIAASWARGDLAAVRVGERRVIRAQIDQRQLRVTVDGEPAWVGGLPAEAFAFDGPVGIRSDNGDFDVELRSSVGSRSSR